MFAPQGCDYWNLVPFRQSNHALLPQHNCRLLKEEPAFSLRNLLDNLLNLQFIKSMVG